MLEAADVSFGYGGPPVLDGVSLAVHPGELVGVIGPNGAGKTSLLRVLAGTRQPTRGVVRLDGAPLGARSRAELARRLAVVPQETHLTFDYPVLEVVLMGRHAHLRAWAVESARDIAIAREALAETGAAAFEDRLFSTLSGGEKQRVVIAAALAQVAGTDDGARPPVLLLDEPTAALDLKHQLGLVALLRTLNRQRQLTIVVSTHDLAFAASLCGTIVMLKDGRVLAAGPADEVLTERRIADLYDVDVEVTRHSSSGRIVVLPIAALPGSTSSTTPRQDPRR